MKKAIIIGASSGIGEALAKHLAKKGFQLGLTARRFDKLQALQSALPTKSWIKQMDVAKTDEAIAIAKTLIQEMDGVDLFIINAGVLLENPEYTWEKEKKTIEVNVMGFTAMANTCMNYFLEAGKGHIVSISSVAALGGDPSAPAYCASKAFISNYTEGLRIKALKSKKEIAVTDIKPGWVNTAMAEGAQTFWMSSPEKAARQIVRAIKKKKRTAYITRRWRLFAWMLKWSPRWFYDKYVSYEQ